MIKIYFYCEFHWQNLVMDVYYSRAFVKDIEALVSWTSKSKNLLVPKYFNLYRIYKAAKQPRVSKASNIRLGFRDLPEGPRSSRVFSDVRCLLLLFRDILYLNCLIKNCLILVNNCTLAKSWIWHFLFLQTSQTMSYKQ